MKLPIPKINFDSAKIRELSKKIFQDKYEKILQDLLELEIENPTDMRVKQKIGEIYFKQERIEEAIDKFKEITDFYEKEDFVLKAIRSCKNILKIRPNLVDFNIKLAQLYTKIGLINETANQYRIAVNHFANIGDQEKLISLSKELVKIDPSNSNHDKLAEIYQNSGMIDEAMQQYLLLAKHYRSQKNYNKLLHYYELILPHQKNNTTMLRDVCILHLRKKRPDRAIKVLDHFKHLEDPEFADLVEKAKLMTEALKKNKK